MDDGSKQASAAQYHVRQGRQHKWIVRNLLLSDPDKYKGLKYILSYNEFGGYCVPAASSYRPAARRILLNEVHERRTLMYLCDNAGDGDVVHAGTYFGDYLPALAKAVAPGATIWAFEPHPEHYLCASFTIEMNKISNVVLADAALGAVPRVAPLRTHLESMAMGGASRLVHGKNVDEDETVEVEVTTIDATVDANRRVSIIQLDVEGSEIRALEGAMETIRKWRPILVLEVIPTSGLLENQWLKDNIMSLGYVPAMEMNRDVALICP